MKSIFLVIVLDGVFAIFFAAIGIVTMADGPTHDEAVIRVRDLVVGFGERIVLDDLDLDVYRGEILGFVGASGAGKSVLMRTIIGLMPKRAGTSRSSASISTSASDDGAAGDRAALGHPVPAGRAVLLADRACRTSSSRCGNISICPSG